MRMTSPSRSEVRPQLPALDRVELHANDVERLRCWTRPGACCTKGVIGPASARVFNMGKVQVHAQTAWVDLARQHFKGRMQGSVARATAHEGSG